MTNRIKEFALDVFLLYLVVSHCLGIAALLKHLAAVVASIFWKPCFKRAWAVVFWRSGRRFSLRIAGIFESRL